RDLLLGNRIMLEQRPVAPDVDARVFEQCLVAGELALGLLQLHLERARVDLREQVALLDELPLGERDPQKLSFDPAPDGYRLQRRYRSEAVQIDVQLCRL